jgi:thiosulfate/3-mercaptopyruvate sulfurtransferase
VLAAASVLLAALPASAQKAPLLVDPAWLAARLGDPSIRIVDMATEPEAYQKGHVAGSVYLNVNDTRIPVSAGGYRLPDADEAARLFRALGIGPGTHVVIYDDTGGLHASRLFFTLDVFGHEKASILDGGVHAWTRAKLPLTTDLPRVAPTGYRPTLRVERVATAEWLRDNLRDPGLAIVDARSPAEHAGSDRRAKRGGHIPGSVNIEWKRNLRLDWSFKPLEELRAMYAARGVSPDKTVVTYCQTHHRAAHSYFVLRLLGYPRVVGYDRSWVEWGNRDDLPIESK